MGNLSDFQTILWPEVKTSNVGFYRKPYAGFPAGSVIQAPFTRAGAGRKVIDASGNLVDAAANVPAWTFPIGGSSSGCPYLSFLPSVENLLTYSEQFDNAAWTKTNVSITANDTTSPDGTSNADLIIEDTSTGNHRVDQAKSVTTGVTYTLSCFAKIGTGNRKLQLLCLPAGIRGYFDLETGGSNIENGTGEIIDMGNGFYFCSVTGVSTVTGVQSIRIQMSNSLSIGSEIYTGDGTSSIYVWGAMLKEGSYISPLDYMPTEASAVTRAQDSITNISDLQGDGYLPSTTEGAVEFQISQVNDGGATTSVFVFVDGSSKFSFRSTSSGLQVYDQVNAAIAFTTNTNELSKVIFSFSNTAIDIYVNGFSEYTASGDFTTSQLFVNRTNDGSGLDLKMLNFAPTALTASQAEAASSWPSFDLMVSDLGYS